MELGKEEESEGGDGLGRSKALGEEMGGGVRWSEVEWGRGLGETCCIYLVDLYQLVGSTSADGHKRIDRKCSDQFGLFTSHGPRGRHKAQ